MWKDALNNLAGFSWARTKKKRKKKKKGTVLILGLFSFMLSALQVRSSRGPLKPLWDEIGPPRLAVTLPKRSERSCAWVPCQRNTGWRISNMTEAEASGDRNKCVGPQSAALYSETALALTETHGSARWGRDGGREGERGRRRTRDTDAGRQACTHTHPHAHTQRENITPFVALSKIYSSNSCLFACFFLSSLFTLIHLLNSSLFIQLYLDSLWLLL